MKLKQNFLILVIGLSPMWFSFVSPVLFSPNYSKMMDGKGLDALELMGISWLVGTPFVLLSGLAISYLLRKKPNANHLTLLGYLLPAIIVNSWYLLNAY